MEWIRLCTLSALFALVCTGCVRIPSEPPVPLSATVLPSSLEALPSPPPVLPEEKPEWAREYLIGRAFAREQDYYRAATSFHRARHLLPDDSPYRPTIVHALLLTYSVAGKYQEAVDCWEREQNHLSVADPDLARDCIALLYEAYSRVDRPRSASHLLTILPADDPLTRRLPLFQRLASNSEAGLDTSTDSTQSFAPEIQNELTTLSRRYNGLRKDPTTARTLNALLPGAGYAYVHQYQTAVTALALNALFIASSVQLFLAHQQAAALIAGGFEVGWYAGGITGAGLAADLYNQRLREELARPFLEKHQLFPLNTLRYQW